MIPHKLNLLRAFALGVISLIGLLATARADFVCDNSQGTETVYTSYTVTRYSQDVNYVCEIIDGNAYEYTITYQYDPTSETVPVEVAPGQVFRMEDATGVMENFQFWYSPTRYEEFYTLADYCYS